MPREFVRSPSSETFKTQLDKPWTALANFEINPLKKKVDWMTSRGHFHAQLFCNFMKPEGEI